jgi:hypothetical protein
VDETTDRASAIEDFLVRAERAHGAYEATELNGVYDAEWPRWYASWAVENGINEVLSRPVDADELAGLLASSWDELQRGETTSPDSWSTFAARRLAGL